MQISLVALNARYSHSCPALFHLRAALNRGLPGCRPAHHQFTINDPYYQTLLAITGERPEAVCFSVYIWNAEYARRLVCDLKRIFPAMPVILGGPGATALASLGLPEGCTLVRGEAEGLGEDFFRDLAGGSLKPEYRAALAPDFAMPYQDEDFARHLASRNIYYESSRGCPFACAYCLSATEAGVRYRGLPEVERELALILAHRPKIVRFVDRTFNAPPERAMAIWRFLLAQPGETLFHFEIAPDIFTEEMLAFLATVPQGRFQFEIGLQSTNPETLSAVNRKMDLTRAGEFIRRLAAMGRIHLHLDLILGLPLETEESFRRSLNEAFALGPHHLQMGLLKILPGAPISREAEKYGLVSSAAPPYPVLATGAMPHAELSCLFALGECLEAFHNSRFFRRTMNYLRKTGEEPFAFFSGLLELCRGAGFFNLAKTQELMSRLMAELGKTRADAPLFIELLRFDWLSSGQRILPDWLGGNESLKETRDHLWRRLPEELPPHYTRLGRNEFFKRGIFVRFSSELLKAVGAAKAEAGSGIVCFLPEQEMAAGEKHQRWVALGG